MCANVSLITAGLILTFLFCIYDKHNFSYGKWRRLSKLFCLSPEKGSTLKEKDLFPFLHFQKGLVFMESRTGSHKSYFLVKNGVSSPLN